MWSNSDWRMDLIHILGRKCPTYFKCQVKFMKALMRKIGNMLERKHYITFSVHIQFDFQWLSQSKLDHLLKIIGWMFKESCRDTENKYLKSFHRSNWKHMLLIDFYSKPMVRNITKHRISYFFFSRGGFVKSKMQWANSKYKAGSMMKRRYTEGDKNIDKQNGQCLSY